MNTILAFLSSHGAVILATTLLHSLWQGALTAGMLYFCLRFIPSRMVNLRYRIACGSMICFVLLFWGTLSFQEIHQAPAASSPAISIAKGETIQNPVVSTSTPINISNHSDSNSLSEPRVPTASIPWERWFITFWGIGVFFMIFRLFWLLKQDRRIIRHCKPLDNQELSAFVRTLQSGMKISQKVLILTSNAMTSPASIGILSPAIILPMSVITGMPAGHIQAILAHEMAHICRLDYLVNLIQMLSESIFFFNPAVWWINRQIRIEREACCDAVAIRYCGDASLYMHALSSAADSYSNTAFQTQTAWAGNQGNKNLLDRILRIAKPSYMSKPPITWSGLLGCIVIAALLIGCVKEGTDLATDTVKKWYLTEKQVEEISKINEEYKQTTGVNQPEDQPIDTSVQYTISGIVKPPTGEMIPEDLGLTLEPARSRQESIPMTLKDGSFSNKIPAGQYKITSSSRQIAYYESDSFIEAVTGDVSGLIVQLEKGFPAQIQFVDADKKPVVGSEITISPVFERPNGQSMNIADEFITDSKGFFLYPHGSHHKYWIDVKKHGYEPLEDKIISLKENEPLVLVQKKSNPATGIVLDQKTKQPIPNADIYIREKQLPTGSHGYGAPPYGKTDNKGIFCIDTIEDKASYLIIVEATGYHPIMVDNITPGQLNRRVEIGPEIIVKGYIYPIMDNKKANKELIYYNGDAREPVSMKRLDHHATLQIIDNKGYFELKKLWPGKVTLRYGEQSKELIVKESLPDVVFNLQDLPGKDIQESTREIIFHFTMKNGTAFPKGKFRVFVQKDNKGSESEECQVENNMAKLVVIPPCSVYIDHEGMIGGWLENRNPDKKITAGKEPFDVTVEVIPAGNIRGKILDKDGLLKDAQIDVGSVEISPLLHVGIGFGSNRQSTFSYTLPLGGKYSASAWVANYVFESSDIYLTQENPSQEITFQIKDGFNVKGKVVDKKGNPLEKVEIKLIYKRDTRESTHSSGPLFYRIMAALTKSPLPPTQLGHAISRNDGSFVLENINPDHLNNYRIVIDDKRYYFPGECNVSPSQSEMVIPLKKKFRLF